MTKQTINTLPKDTRTALIQKIIEGNSALPDLVEWLKAQGFVISKSALSRYSIITKERISRLSNVLLKLKLSPLTITTHLDELETLSELHAKRLILDDAINTLESVILATEKTNSQTTKKPVM